MNKKALVTGATGFVGSNLVRGLLNDDWQVDVIIRPTSTPALLSDVKEKIRTFNFNGETEDLLGIATDSKPDVIFHLASLFLSEHKPEQVEALIKSNVLFGVQLLEAMSKARIQYIINTGTSWEHCENKAYSPINLYAATKRAFQDLLQYYVETTSIKAITLKLFDTYGPNDPRPKLLNLLLEAARSGERLVLSPGEQQIDLVHIDDVIRAYLCASEYLLNHPEMEYESFVVCTGAPMTIRQIVALIEQVIGKQMNVQWGGRPYRDREVMVPWSSTKQLKDGKPEIDLEEGLKMMLNQESSS